MPQSKTSNTQTSDVQKLNQAFGALLILFFVVTLIFSNFLGATGTFSFIPVEKKAREENTGLITTPAASSNSPTPAASSNSPTPAASVDSQPESDTDFKAPRAPDASMVRHWQGKEDAPITIILWADPQCSYCKEFHDQIYTPILKPRIDNGDVRFGYMPFVFLGERSNQAANAAECVSENNGDFFAFMDNVYANQSSFKSEDFFNWAEELGVNRSTIQSCIENQEYISRIKDTNAQIEKLGGQFTPTVFVDGQYIENWYDGGMMSLYIENKTGNIDTNGSKNKNETPLPPQPIE